MGENTGVQDVSGVCSQSSQGHVLDTHKRELLVQ